MKRQGTAAVVCGTILLTVGLGCGGGSNGGGGTPAPYTFKPATTVIGQPDFTTGDSNRGLATGTAANALAQPTSVSVDGNTLLVADWSSHRVLGFQGIPLANDPSADFVIGQPDFQTRSPGLDANRLTYPRHALIHQGTVLVCDKENHRVLIWNVIPLADQWAGRVLGQTGFGSSGTSAGPSGLRHSHTAFVVGSRWIVADQGNRRVLIWNAPPAANGAPANLVLGQPDFSTTLEATSQSGMASPVAVWSDGTRLVVADSTNHRVLIWNAFPTADFIPADVVIGQSTFDSSVQGGGPAGLTFPTGVASDGTRLFVADGGNHRVLVFEAFPAQNGASAHGVLGQSDLFRTTENDDDQDGQVDGAPSARTMYAPGQLTYFGGRLYVPDFHNSRVLVFEFP